MIRISILSHTSGSGAVGTGSVVVVFVGCDVAVGVVGAAGAVVGGVVAGGAGGVAVAVTIVSFYHA
eukprot:3416967-Pyramimonas_sp.AAC.1